MESVLVVFADLGFARIVLLGFVLFVDFEVLIVLWNAIHEHEYVHCIFIFMFMIMHADDSYSFTCS